MGIWLGNLFLETLLGNLLLRTWLGNLFPGTFGNLAWEIFANLWQPVPRNLWGSCLGPLLENLLVGTLLGNLSLPGTLSKPCLGTLLEKFAWKHVLGNLFLGTFANLALEPGSGNLLGNLWESLPGPCLETCSWEPLGFFGNLFWAPCLPSLGTLLGNCLGTSYWEPLRTFLGNLGNLAWEPCLETLLGNLVWNLLFGTMLGNLDGNLFLGTFANLALEPAWNLPWEPLTGNLFLRIFAKLAAWEPALGNLAWKRGNLWESLGTCSWEPCLRTLLGNLGNLACEPSLKKLAWELGIFGNLFLGTLLGNLFLHFGNLWEPVPGNFACLAWEPLRTLLVNVSWKPALGNLCEFLGSNLCDPCLGTLLGNPSWKPGNVRFWLLRPAPGPLLWLKTPS